MAKKNVNEVAAMPQCKVYGVKCKGEGNNPTPSYTTLHHPTQREATGEVFDNEYEYLTHECMDVVCVYVIARHCTTLQRAHHIIQRDMHSHLKYIQLAPEMVYAEIYALTGFSLSETLSMYHYHLQRALGAHVQVWVSTKGGKL